MALPRFLSHNLGWKAIALVSATLVWMTLKSGTPSRIRPSGSRTFRQLPVSIMTGVGDSRILRVDPVAVDVQVSGAPEVLPRVRPRDIRVFVDLTPFPETRPSRLRVEVHTPSGVTLEKVTPAEVSGRSLAPIVPEP